MSKKIVLIIVLISIVFLTSLSLSIYLYKDKFSESLTFKNPFNFQTQEKSENSAQTINNITLNEENFVVSVIENYGDSVVSVNYLDNIFSDESEAIGSGVVVSSDGLIVTNKHVVSNEDIAYEITFQNGDKYPVQKIVRDKVYDLALIKIEAKDLKTVKYGNTENIKLGQKVIAVGNALGFSNTVSLGIVSGLKREIEIEGKRLKNLIQTDAAINEGNSGGALFNSIGSLIGINTAKSPLADNIGFAIPVEYVQDLVNRYKSGQIDENSEPAFLGINYSFRDIESYVKKGIPIGPIVSSVIRNSPAYNAGIKTGDIIVSIDDKEFSDETELSEFIASKNPGDKISILVYRVNRNITLEAVLGSRKSLLR